MNVAQILSIANEYVTLQLIIMESCVIHICFYKYDFTSTFLSLQDRTKKYEMKDHLIMIIFIILTMIF
jgi:hypothetical protein